MIKGSNDFIEEWKVKFLVKVENTLHIFELKVTVRVKWWDEQ